jgi:ferritin
MMFSRSLTGSGSALRQATLRFKTTTTHKRMSLSPSVEKALNQQIAIEATASQLYLGWGSWAERAGFPGVSSFFYAQSAEERQHMLKMIQYVNKRGGSALIPATEAQNPKFSTDLLPLFESFLVEEEVVTHHINEVIHECVTSKDYITHDFLQWFAQEQIQEESLCRDLIDRLKLLEGDKSGLYVFDRDIMTFRKE